MMSVGFCLPLVSTRLLRLTDGKSIGDPIFVGQCLLSETNKNARPIVNFAEVTWISLLASFQKG